MQDINRIKRMNQHEKCVFLWVIYRIGPKANKNFITKISRYN